MKKLLIIFCLCVPFISISGQVSLWYVIGTQIEINCFGKLYPGSESLPTDWESIDGPSYFIRWDLGNEEIKILNKNKSTFYIKSNDLELNDDMTFQFDGINSEGKYVFIEIIFIKGDEDGVLRGCFGFYYKEIDTMWLYMTKLQRYKE